MAVRQMGKIGTEELFENEHTKTWKLVLEPGQSSPWHRHMNHYLFVVTEPGTLRAEYGDGSTAVRAYNLGDVVMGEKDSVHQVTNIGTKRWSNAIVEFKGR